MTQTKTSHDNANHGASGEADYYAILGVAPDASHEAIHQAYRRLAKLWHPDRYTFAPPELHDRAERRMRAISRAWAELGDPVQRRRYDRRRFGPPRAAHTSQPSDTEDHLGNGAGIFAGMLCIILALPFLLNLLNGTFRETWEISLAAGMVIVLLGLAGLFFTSDSPASRLATSWAEGEPQGFHEQPVAAYEPHETPHDESPIGAATDGAGDTGATDDADGSHQFDMLVEQALATIPDTFKPSMRNVVVQVEREPSAETLQRMEVGAGHTLLGLYTGVPLTSQGAQEAGPEMVTIFRGPIERYCQHDPQRIRDQVRRTVLHEVAHHFGIDHDEMPDWIK